VALITLDNLVFKVLKPKVLKL